MQERKTKYNENETRNRICLVRGFQIKTERKEEELMESEETDLISPSDVKIFDLIGAGSYGTVHLAHCRGQVVAVKILKKQQLGSDKLLELQKEIAIMRRLKSNNLVLMLGICDDGVRTSIVMEYVEGWNLSQLIYAKPTHVALTKEQKLKITKDIALGCHWLHQLDPPIVHRDLKPENVMVSADLRTVKLCDFGFSCIKPTDEESRIVGTPMYMPLERFNGNPASEKSDVYSFALTIWELWEEKKPFSEYEIKEPMHLFQAILNKNTFSDKFPEPIADIIDRCWDEKPHLRLSFSQIVEELDEAIVDSLILDPAGRELWKRGKGKDVFYPFELSWPLVLKLIEGLVNKGPLYEEGTLVECLKMQIAEAPFVVTPKRDVVVKCEKFGIFLKNFGPLTKKTIPEFERFCSEGYYHGEIDAATAELRLSAHGKGSFLVRNSTSERGRLVLSKHEGKEEGNQKFCHQFIIRDTDTNQFAINLGEKAGVIQVHIAPTLTELIEKSATRLGLKMKKRCETGSRYAAVFKGTLFTDKPKTRYRGPLTAEEIENQRQLEEMKKNSTHLHKRSINRSKEKSKDKEKDKDKHKERKSSSSQEKKGSNRIKRDNEL